MSDREKFKSLVHYVCWRCSDDPTKLGSVQLNKALWLSDLKAYYELGQPITNARYVKRQYGPVPSSILPALRELESAGILTAQQADHFGKRKWEYIVHKKAASDFLSAKEKKIVNEMIAFVTEQHSAASISDASHDHIWKAAEDGEEIPHFTVFAKPGRIGADEREWAKLALEGER
jgi:hypothetical protein